MARKRPGKAKVLIPNSAIKNQKNTIKNALAGKENKKSFCFK